MTDPTESKASKEPAGGIPQAVADELAQLASEVRVMEQKASRSWKTTAIFFVVLLAVIATYLGLLVYRPVKNLLDEESVVQMVFTHVNSMLVNAGAKPLDDPGIVDWAVAELEKKAPVLMKEHAQPLIEKGMAKMPEWRQQIVAQVKEKGPAYFDKGIESAQNQVLPRVRDLMVERVVAHASAQLDTVQDQMDEVVGQIIEGNIQNMKDLNPEDQDALKRRMEATMEEQLAPILDPMFEGIAHGIETTKGGLTDLVMKLNAGTLNHEDRLEIAMVQLTDALFRLKATTPEEKGMGLWELFQQTIQQGQQGLGTIEVQPSAPTPALKPQTVSERIQGLEGRIAGMESALKNPELSEDGKKGVQSQIDAAKKELETLKSQPAGSVAVPPTAGAPVLAVLKQKVAGLTEALKNPDLTPQAKSAMEEQLKKAQQELEDAQTKE